LGWTATDAGLLLIPSSLMTGFMMPFIGKMIQNGVPQKYMVALGLCIFFGFSFVMYSRLTNDTGAEHMFWPLIYRGIGLGLLFVPVMTLSLSTLSGKSIGEGAAFTGMMRQLGGSFGIALITTFISRFSQGHRVNLLANLDPTDFEVQQRINQMQASFIAKGFTPNEALGKAYQLLEGSVMKQATVLSYMDVFLYIGILFLACVPFVLMIKQGNNKVDTSSLH
jgi:DHA2 family multidrug resistance protein